MSKYKVQVIAKQRYTITVDATDEETAVQGTLDLIEENPEGYITGIFNKFLMGPEVEVTEIEEASI
jgi:hypothetical protein